MTEDFIVAVARGKVPGVTRFYKIGKNADIDTAASEDIISQGGTWAAPTTAEKVNIVSTSTNDTSNGTGLRTLTITGLNENYSEVSETITLNGTANVLSVNKYWIVYRMIGNTAGSTGANVGTITCTSTAANSSVQQQMQPTENQAQSIIYQVPLGKSLLLYDWAISTASTGFTTGNLLIKPFGGIFNVRGNTVVNGSGATSDMYDFHIPLRLPEKTIVKITGTVSANNQSLSATMQGIVIDNTVNELGYDETSTV